LSAYRNTLHVDRLTAVMVWLWAVLNRETDRNPKGWADLVTAATDPHADHLALSSEPPTTDGLDRVGAGEGRD
jgi:hypothetical protein